MISMASLTGVEPAAFRLGGEPSIHLRYRDVSVCMVEIHTILVVKGDCSNTRLGGGRSILLSYRNTYKILMGESLKSERSKFS